MSEWILVSERLPEEYKGVLIQFKSGRDCPHNNIAIANIGTHEIEDNNFTKTGTKTVWYTNEYYYDLDRVIAWMPLPEPYKEEVTSIKGDKDIMERKTLKELEESFDQEIVNYNYTMYRPTNAGCSKCGHQLYINDSKTLASYPPRYEYICKDCGNVEYSFIHL